MGEQTEPHFTLTWFNDGIEITEYESTEQDSDVTNEWFFEWSEVFEELTGIEDYAPDIV